MKLIRNILLTKKSFISLTNYSKFKNSSTLTTSLSSSSSSSSSSSYLSIALLNCSRNDILQQCNSKTIQIDLNNNIILPGFTDSHCHFLDGGLRLLSVQLRDVKTKEEFKQKVKDYIQTKESGTWILGGDWNHYNFGGELPTKEWIDDISPNNPVWLNRMDGHMSLANSYALNLCGINNQTSDIPGGTIVRDSNGNITGILKDNACNLITTHIPRHSPENCAEALEKAMDYVSSKGVTKVHTMVTVDCVCGLWPKNLGKDADKEDMEIAYEELEVYHNAYKQGKLRTRIQAALPLASYQRLLSELNKTNSSLNNDWLKATHLKAMIDGSLGSHTAAFHEPYTDDITQTDKGHLIWDEQEIEKYIAGATENDLQVMVHAIGDRANHILLNIFEKIQNKLKNSDNKCNHYHSHHHHHCHNNNNNNNNNENKFPAFRVEHAQHISPSDIPRFGQLGVIASMQMSHLAEDGCWASSAIGEKRMKTSWPMKSLLDSGAMVVLGSDWFVTEPSPLYGIHSAVTRQTIDGKNSNGLIPSECVTVNQAVKAYTIDPARATKEEHQRGSIEIGKLADLVVLDQDIFSIPSNEILQTNILTTIVGGKIVYQK